MISEGSALKDTYKYLFFISGSPYNGYHNQDAYPFGDSFVGGLSPHQAIDNLEYHLVNHKQQPRTTSTTSSHSSNHNHHHHPVLCSSSSSSTGRRKTMSSDDETDDHEYYNDFQRELQPLNHRAETTV